ncbi:MAG: iron export ABC transporter permease subunit FetB [Deltaproteobacteria bacterium]|nr:MAG: iron export ABC transporter permease subunit FetB [Deltaproteobacteria bacterium]
MNGVLPLEWTDLAIASGLVALAGAISLALRLGVTRRLTIAATRTVVQLILVGLILEWVFALDRWWLVLMVLGSMVVNAGVAAVRRAERRYPGIYATGLVAVTLSSVFTTAVVTEVVVGVTPWYDPRYVIPLMGMVLGNSLNGISLTLDRFTADLERRQGEVELWLSLGATVWEASRPLLVDAVRAGLVPILNAMTVAGIVSLPGMMTGQILAGSPPLVAVRYQIVVMFMIAGAASLGALLAGLLSFRRLTTRRHQLVVHRLRRA